MNPFIEKILEEREDRGIEKGREIGREEGLEEVAINLKLIGAPLEQIQQVTGLSVSRICQL